MSNWELLYSLGDTPWEKGAPHPALLEWLGRNEIAGRTLAPGCGFGHDVRALAEAGAQVLGVDIAPSAIRRAMAFPPVGNERYQLGDIFDFGGTGEFDWVVEHTCFCAIPPERRPEYVQSVRKLLRPGGKLLGIFFLELGEDGPPFGSSIEELDALFSPVFDLIEEWTSVPTYPGREGLEIMRLMVRK